MAEKSSSPLSQFEVHEVAAIGPVGGLDLSLTNVAAFALAASGLVILFLSLATQRATLVPGRLQVVAEMAYDFVSGMIKDVIGPEGLRFLPFIFTLFMFILTCNLMGMFPIFPTVTSQLAVTLTLGLVSISVVIIFGIYKQGLGFLRLFAPAGVPWPMYAILTPIEIISFLARPLTLGFRLFANMLAGHILLKLFGGFVASLGALGFAGMLTAILPFFGAFFVTGLEFLVAFLQAYVFAILTVIYLNDVVHGHH